MADDATHTHSMPASQALQIVELCRRWEVTPEALLQPLGLDTDVLGAPGARVRPQTMIALIERARRLTGEPGLGFYLGLQKRLAMYGFLGLATMTSSTLREALEGAVKLSHSVTTAITLRLREESGTAALTVEEHFDMGPARDAVTFSFFVGMHRIGEDLIGESGPPKLQLAIERPAYFDRFEHILPRTSFGHDIHRLLLPAALLDTPLPSPDRGTMTLARQQCEQTLIELGFDRSFPAQLRRELFGPRGARSLDEIADCLHVSTRTLKRRLQEQGLTFTEVRDQECTERAQHLLRTGAMPLEQIADRLGYASMSSFTRAFRRWTDQTPTAYRKHARNEAVTLVDNVEAGEG